MKKPVKTASIIFTAVISVAAAALILFNPVLLQTAKETKYMASKEEPVLYSIEDNEYFPPLHTRKSNQYVPHELEGNKDRPVDEFLSVYDILEELVDPKTKESGSYIQKIELETYEQYTSQLHPGYDTYCYPINKDRMIYVVVSRCPEGINCKAGIYSDATIYTVFDALSGRILETAVKSKRIGTGPH